MKQKKKQEIQGIRASTSRARRERGSNNHENGHDASVAAHQREGHGEQESIFASVASDTTPTAAVGRLPIAFGSGGTSQSSGSRRILVDEGELPPASPSRPPMLLGGVNEIAAATTSSGVNDHGFELPSSLFDVETGWNAEANDIGNEEARNLEANATRPDNGIEQVQSVPVHPGAVAVEGPGGPPVASNISSAPQEQHEDEVSRDPTVQVQAQVVGDDRALLYNLQERVDRMEINQTQPTSAQPPALAEAVVPDSTQVPQISAADGAAIEDETLSNSQQQDDAKVGLFGWLKAEKSRIHICMTLVLVVVVIVLGVALGLSVSGGGSSNTSQTDTSGPTASPLASLEPVATDVPTPKATASPEATLNPTPPPTVVPTTPDPTQLPTPSPTPPPTPPPTLPPTPLVPAPTPPPTVTNIPVSPTRELIENVSVALNGGAALQNASSPQSLALEWLEGEANLPMYSDTQKIQRFALASLYHSTNGAQWDGDNLGWLSDDPECEWGSDASTPCADGQLINRLGLWQDNLSGSIPPELALLSSSLVYLDLDSNNIGGSIPSELGLLSNLGEMRLYNNNIGGSMPSELGLLSNLEGMWLWGNEITGRIPTEVGLLTKMTNLNLRDNALTGAIPTVFNSMTNLDSLRLYNNNFTGEFECPDFIGACRISCDDPGNVTCRSL